MLKPASLNAILRDAIGIGIGVAAYGVSFGALGVAAGLSLLQTQVLSLVMFTGASQFALVGVLAAGGGAGAAIAAALLLGFRNLPYALRMSSLLQVKGWRRLLAAHWTIDESTGMGLAHEVKPDGALGGRWAFWLTGLSVFVFWNLSTLLGALAATGAGDPRVWGLDAAICAGFIALLAPQVTDRRRLTVLLAGVVMAVAAIPLFQPGVPILAAGAVAAVIGLGQKLPRS